MQLKLISLVLLIVSAVYVHVSNARPVSENNFSSYKVESQEQIQKRSEEKGKDSTSKSNGTTDPTISGVTLDNKPLTPETFTSVGTVEESANLFIGAATSFAQGAVKGGSQKANERVNPPQPPQK